MQDIAVYFIVAGAACFVARGWWRAARKGGGCGSCSSGKACKSKAPSEPQLVQISLGAPKK